MSSPRPMAASLMAPPPPRAPAPPTTTTQASQPAVDPCQRPPSPPPPARDVTLKREPSADITTINPSGVAVGADELVSASGLSGRGRALSVFPPVLTSDEYKKQTDREKQNAASTLLAQLLGSRPIQSAETRPDDTRSSQNEPQHPAGSASLAVAATPDIDHCQTSLDNSEQPPAPCPPSSSSPSLNHLGEYHQLDEDTEATDRVLKAAWDMSEPHQPFSAAKNHLSQTDYSQNNNKNNHNNVNTFGTNNDNNHRDHDFILNAISNQTTFDSDVNKIYSEIASLTTPKTAKEAVAQNSLMAAEYLATGSPNSGPAVRMVGYPELPTTSEADPSRHDDSESVPSSEPRIQAYAKLEFDDGHFYVNTYSFVLGRDVRAARAALQRESHVKQVKHARGPGSSGGSVAATPKKSKQDECGSGDGNVNGNDNSNGNGNGDGVMGSVVSDRGGIMGFDPDVPQQGPPQMSWKSSNYSSSADHPNHPMLHMSLSEQQQPQQHQQQRPQGTRPADTIEKTKDYNALAMESLLQSKNEPKKVDTLTLLPSAEACPTIPVHPPAPADGVVSSHRSISRKHVKISYNFNRSLFEMEVMGRNGAFKGADWLAPGQVRPLHSGDFIQIGGVRVRFLLPDVPIGDTGAEHADSPIPVDEEGAPADDAADEEDALDAGSDAEAEDSLEPGSERKSVEATKAKASRAPESSARASADATSTPQQPAKRRGPGRPPKDGIMSKRERAEIAREQKLAAKREANGGVTPPPPNNRLKIGKDLKEGGAVEEPPKPEKRKYTKRKKPEADSGDVVLPSIEENEASVDPGPGVETSPRIPSAKKRKPSKSPSPEYPPESYYTSKELAKPPYNYAVLIYDALSESPTPMTLKQIYRSLKLKYPYFRFKCETEGWTSSVRHNLNGNTHLFMHAERDGKGWSWKIIPGASVDKEKKRRPSPSPMQDAGIYAQSQHYQQPPSTPQYPRPQGNGPPNSQQFPYQPPTPASHPPPPPPPLAPGTTGNGSFTTAPPQSPHHTNLYPSGVPPSSQFTLPASLRNTMPSAFVPPSNPIYRSPYAPTPPPPRPPAQGQQQHQYQPHRQQPNQLPRHPPQQNPPPSQPLRQSPAQPRPPPQQQLQPYQQQPHSQPPSTFAFQARPQPVPTSHGPSPHALPAHAVAKPQDENHGAPTTTTTTYRPSTSAPDHQQNPLPASQPTAASSAPPSQPPPEDADPQSFTTRANQAIDNFEAVLIEDYDDKEYIRQVLRSARDRVLNGAKESSFQGGEPKDEAVIMDALRGIIGQLNNEGS